MIFARSLLSASKSPSATAAFACGFSGAACALFFGISSTNDEEQRGLFTPTTARTEAATKTNPPGHSSPKKDDAKFEGQCLKRQMHTPNVPYPAWDYNWDGQMTANSTLESVATAEGLRASKAIGKTRHIILVRHGQYEMGPEKDEERVLTPLGRRQALQTGHRLAVMSRGGMGGLDERFDQPCRIKAIRVSDMARAKETASLIASMLPGVPVSDPDPMLNEALPAPIIPARADVPDAEQEIDANRERIEEAFHKYVHRATAPLEGDVGTEQEFEIIVCHGNVIRYLFCRALQLPPEAWLRFSTFNCSLTYLVVHPNGYVHARMMGDTGHLAYDDVSFSASHGFNW